MVCKCSEDKDRCSECIEDAIVIYRLSRAPDRVHNLEHWDVISIRQFCLQKAVEAHAGHADARPTLLRTAKAFEDYILGKDS